MYLPNQLQPNRKSKKSKSPQSGIKPQQPASDLGKRYVKYFWHPWNAIIAPVNNLHSKPDWRTIHYYLQPSQLWAYHQDRDQLIGIRFNSYTRYATIDIDAGGDYHNLEAYQTIKAALEDIGIVSLVPIQSSYSQGYHLIIPFTAKIPTFNLACALEQTIKDAGFNIRPGHIEIYPNPKPWAKDIITNYKAIRCPMQPGSGAYLLDDDLQPISDSVTTFLNHCDLAASRQDLTRLRYICKKARKRHTKEQYQQKAGINIEQWQADWEQIIATGWTGYGQTNTLLQIIVGYGIVFLDLQNEDLVKYAVETARNAPGYKQYCRHQRQIENRVRDWVKCTEKHQWYTPYANCPKRPLGTFINTFALAIAGDSQTENHQNNVIPFETTKIRNQQRSQQTQERIEEIVKYLDAQTQTEQDTETGLNQGITERGKQISAEYKLRYNRTLSQNTLYKHKHLWHPQWYTADTRENNGNPSDSIQIDNIQTHHTQSDVIRIDFVQPSNIQANNIQNNDIKANDTNSDAIEAELIQTNDILINNSLTSDNRVNSNQTNNYQVNQDINSEKEKTEEGTREQISSIEHQQSPTSNAAYPVFHQENNSVIPVNQNQENSINPSDSSLNENINSENSKQPKNSSNPYPECNYTQFAPKVDIEKKSTAQNYYAEGNYTQLPYMKVLCTPSATSAVGAEVAGVDQLQNQDCQKHSSINQSTENQQQPENQSIINSANSAENHFNQTNEQLENSTNASVLQSNELNQFKNNEIIELTLVQYFLCLLLRSASSKTDKKNLSMTGDNELHPNYSHFSILRLVGIEPRYE